VNPASKRVKHTALFRPQGMEKSGFILQRRDEGCMSDFEKQYAAWFDRQLSGASGERKRRLQEGQGHAEKCFAREVWWEAVGNFEHLHAEYEVQDFRDGSRFLDHAYIRPPYAIDWEIDGFGTHARDLDRRSFSDNLMRQNHLMLDGWLIFRFSYDDIRAKPRQCQQFVQQLIGRLYGSGPFPTKLTATQKELLRWAIRKPSPFTVQEACEHLGIGQQSARTMLHALIHMQMISPASGTQRIRSYRIASSLKAGHAWL
jgi:hypothetical protein